MAVQPNWLHVRVELVYLHLCRIGRKSIFCLYLSQSQGTSLTGGDFPHQHCRLNLKLDAALVGVLAALVGLLGASLGDFAGAGLFA